MITEVSMDFGEVIIIYPDLNIWKSLILEHGSFAQKTFLNQSHQQNKSFVPHGILLMYCAFYPAERGPSKFSIPDKRPEGSSAFA